MNDTISYIKRCQIETNKKFEELINFFKEESNVRLADNENHLRIPASSTAVKLLESNVNRREVTVSNESAVNLFVKKGAGVTLTNYSYLLRRGDTLNIDDFRGEIWAIWENATGNAMIVETF